MGNEPDDSVTRVARRVLEYERPPNERPPALEWERVGSVVFGFLLLLLGNGLLVSAAIIFAHWSSVERALWVMSVVFSAAGIALVAFGVGFLDPVRVGR